MDKFKKLRISEEILRVLEEERFKEPTEIQEKAIPLVLEGKDVLGSAATGSGKTLAFGVGIIQSVKHREGIQALVMTPTRELAEQVARSLRKFSKNYSLSIKEIYGGVSIGPQIEAIRRADIIVGTPGRILDHLRQRTLNLQKVKVLVLDEADRMLDMGFIEDVQLIIEHCPNERQTLLFSATISSDIERIARHYMKNPVHVAVESYVDPAKLHQVFYDVPQNQKFSLLAHLLQNEHSGLVMVFCNTRRNADNLVRNLKRHDLHAVAIHGGLAQNKRNRVMQMFHSQEVLILVCTDVAARGLDIKNVSHIYNYDVPQTSKEYIHRIGRTARAGKEGKAISLVSQKDYMNFNSVCEDDSLRIKQETLPEFEQLVIRFDDERRGRGSSRGGFQRSYERPGSFGRRRESGSENRGSFQDRQRTGHYGNRSGGLSRGFRGRGGGSSRGGGFGRRESGGRDSRSGNRGRRY